MMMKTSMSFARYETINEDKLCIAAKFIMAEDDIRQTKFNAVSTVSSAASERDSERDSDYRPHTVAINAKINGKVNTKRKASMETKKAVTLAILGTALTENGDVTEITQKFKAEKASLEAEYPESYQTNILYLHRLALHTIEVLANSLVIEALDTADADIDAHFRNLAFLTGIKRDAFMELFNMAQLAHQAGLDARGKEFTFATHLKDEYQLNSSAVEASSESHYTDIPQSMTLDQILKTYCDISDISPEISLEQASTLLTDKFVCVMEEQHNGSQKCIHILKNGKKAKKIKEEDHKNTYFLQFISDNKYRFIESAPNLVFETEEPAVNKDKIVIKQKKKTFYNILINRYSLFIIPSVLTVGTILGIKTNLFSDVFNGGKFFTGMPSSLMRFLKK